MPPKKAAASPSKKGGKEAVPPPVEAPPPPPVDDGPPIDEVTTRIRSAFLVFDPEDTTLMPTADLESFFASLGLFITPSELSRVVLPTLLAEPLAEGAAPPTSVTYACVLAATRRLLTAHAYPPPSGAELLAAFAAFDKGATGVVNVDKLRRALAHPSVEGALSPAEFATLVANFPAADPPDAEPEARGKLVRYTDYVAIAARR